MTPRSEHLFWGGLVAAGLAYEGRAISSRPTASLSDATRVLFQTHTRAGRIAFTFAWGGLTAWYAYHILSGEQP